MVKYDEDREVIIGYSYEGVDNLYKNSFNRVEDMKFYRYRGVRNVIGADWEENGRWGSKEWI